ncbi:vacuolar protein sorting-associated protein 16, putative [Plasmodium malariae]|uniref:Vacuolar protein sorting-associated protein 16, putative n=3 Tax=Plasmodium malariae TaxID=5858 RepID=A0A1D3TFJ5_PLAMA|nr:vacuolar protein sorting-associated protein 16, putative [Plasmodium malariae]SCP03681.1 vacuolar protein sorting-associated protein 16, putative [Plasmodium malariae]
MNTNEWNNIDNTYYGKQKLSNMLWSNEDVLKDSLTCSGYLGLIAVLRNKDKFDVYKKEDNLKIYTNIGRVISSCRLNSDGLICFGWNKNNDLVLLFKDNIVRVYSCFCEKIFVFSLDENIKNEGILYGSICEEGIIIITERLNIYVNYYFSGNNCFRYPAVDLKGKPNCVCTVEEDKLSDELNIEHNYFDTRVNNDLLRMNIKNYITNAFENKKENVNEMVNNKNVVLTEGKENYNIQMEDDRIKRRTNRELIKTSSYDVKRTEVDNTTSNSNRVSYRGKKEKELNIHLIIALCSGGFVLVNKHRFKYYDVYDNNNDNNNNNNYNINNNTSNNDKCNHAYINMCISKSGTILAFLSDNGIIRIYLTNNLNNCIEESVLDSKKSIKQIVWCGDDCLAVYTPMITPSNYIQHMLFIGGPKNQWIPYQYRHDLYLIGDIYGVKIVSKENCEYISRIRKSTFNIFSIGSCTPSAMLYYSYEKYRNGNICLEDEIRAFNNNLNIAIEECLNAATHEYNESIIKLLLQTSLFGKNFMKVNYDCKKFLLTCLYLRICMNVRKPPLDIFITASELQYITIPTFVLYIAKRKEYFLAYRICEYAGIRSDNILIEWCKEKIEKSIELTDEQLCRAITDKIGNKKNIDYSYIAFVAAKCLRPQLATIIIQYEENRKKQIDMLLKLANYSLSIEKAILSKDMELVYLCIINILNQEKINANGEKELSVLIDVFNKNVHASDCFYVYCKKTKQYNLLKEFYEKNGQHSKAAFVTLDLALSKKNLDQKKTWLAYSAGFLTTDQMNSHIKFVHTSIMNNIDLLNYQKELEMKYNKKSAIGYPHKIQGLSLMETVNYVISVGEFLDADHLFKKFKISEPKYWRCKIYALAKNKYFDELYNFANYRVSPIGMDYFIECCYEFGSVPLTIKLIQKIKDINLQYKWFTKLNMHEEAESVLEEIKAQKMTTTSLFQTITDAISNMR